MLEIDDLYERARLILPAELDAEILQRSEWTSLLAALQGGGIERPRDFLYRDYARTSMDGREQLEVALAALARGGRQAGTEPPAPARASIPFFEVLRPFWNHYAAQIESSLARMRIDYQTALLEEITLYAGKELSRIADLVLYLEWVKFRDGDIGRPSKYRAFCARFQKGEWARIFLNYPVLARLIGAWLLNARTSMDVFLRRLAADWALLRGAYGLPPRRSLCSLRLGLSDAHAGGQSVVRFTSPHGDAVYYKPRSMANEAFFFRNVASVVYDGVCVDALAGPIDRGEYGWMRDLATKRETTVPCPNPLLIVGRLAGAMHFLNGGDLHFENVVDVNGHLVPVDLEVMFRGALHHRDRNGMKDNDNVLSTGLFTLEAPIDSNSGDISGLFAEEFLTFHPQHRFKDIGSDEMEIEFERPLVRIDRPEYLAGSGAAAGSLASGFQAFYEEVVASRSHWEDVYGRAGKCVSRLVVRPTATYARILQKLRQPKFLRSNVDYSLELCQLFKLVLDAPRESTDEISAICRQEYMSLGNLDVPSFYFRAAQRSLLGGREDLFAASGLERGRKKLAEAGAPDLKEQLAWVGASGKLSRMAKGRTPGDGQSLGIRIFETEEPIHFCEHLAHGIMSSHVGWQPRSALWINLEIDAARNRIVPGRSGLSLYSGLAGRLLFLLTLRTIGRELDRPVARLDDFLRAAATYLAATMAENASEGASPQFSGIEGLGGEILTVAALAENDAPTWKPVLEAYLSALPRLDDEALGRVDIVSGCAGLLVGVAKARQVAHGLSISASLVACADQLLGRAIEKLLESALPQEGRSVAWKAIDDEPVLPGFAHGTGGIRTGLLRAHALAPSESLAAAIRQARAFERSVRSAKGCPWLDRRVARPPVDRRNFSWCHGLSGIGFAECAQVIEGGDDRDSCLSNIDRIARTLLGRREPELFDSYCCGEAGLIEFLFVAGHVTGNSRFSRGGDQRLQRLMRRTGTSGLMRSCVGPSEISLMSGLFQGWAGIGMAALSQYRRPGGNLGALMV